MIHAPEYIQAVTSHTRLGAITNHFQYGVDYVLIDPEEASHDSPALFSRNRFNLNSVHDVDHGGALKAGNGLKWARDAFFSHGLTEPDVHILLLTQPRFLSYSFNPVSFWLALKGTQLLAVIAEVSTPFGHRHSYLCHQEKFAPITKDTQISKPKLLHVSPFQDLAGCYEFRFEITAEHIDIRILYRNGSNGVIATLRGARAPMSNLRLIKANIRRPFGALRTMFLIHRQALRLKLKGAKYRSPPSPPTSEVS